MLSPPRHMRPLLLLFTAVLAFWPLIGCDRYSGPTYPGGSDGPSGGGESDGPGDPTPVAVSVGTRHGCAVRASGAVACWGDNTFGQLGTGTRESDGTPAPVRGIEDAVEVVTGRGHSCARLEGGAVSCWGDNGKGQLGDGTGRPKMSSTKPLAVRNLVDAVSLSAGDDHTCAQRKTGSIVCWGDNSLGQLGTAGRTAFVTPMLLGDLVDAVEVAAGGKHTCVRRKTGAVLCFGANLDGQLGDGSTNSRNRMAGVQGVTAAKELAVGYSTSCARSLGGVQCWGRGFGKVPVVVAGFQDAVELEVGADHVCAITAKRKVSCIGKNETGQLGNGTLDDSTDKVVGVNVLSSVKDLSVGARSACALTQGGVVSCWGSNDGGVLGTGKPGTLQSLTPITVAEVTSAAQIDSGLRFGCAVESSGELKCWGDNAFGQLGVGTKTPSRTALVVGVGDVVSVATGPEFACAAKKDGRVACWGKNDAGQLGNKGRASTKPVPVAGVSDAVEVTAGAKHACARRRGGGVMCWGNNEYGQLGNGLGEKSGAVSVQGLGDAADLVAGDQHTCARRAAGSVVCWGANTYGQLGNGVSASMLKTPTPRAVPVTKLTDVVSLHAGSEHTCAARKTGAAVCWGRNREKQLGSGTSSDVWTTRVPVKQVSNAMAVGGGPLHTCAAVAGRTIRCWGINSGGQLGNGTRNNAPTPTGGPSLDAVQLSGGTDHTCARLRSGGVACWGDNEVGQLGDGGKPFAASPVAVRL